MCYGNGYSILYVIYSEASDHMIVYYLHIIPLVTAPLFTFAYGLTTASFGVGSVTIYHHHQHLEFPSLN